MSASVRQTTVAVVGAGPSGLFAAQALLDQADAAGIAVRVDVLERLPAPFGLLRYGVAPDHTSIKAVADRLGRVFADDRVRFFGLVELGTDLTRAELLAAYDAVVYAAGAAQDRRLSVPGEELPGSGSAREFVAWYSGHPDAEPQRLAGVRTAVAFGVGNVAVDVARILLSDPARLLPTDMPQPVLDELRAARIRDVWVVGRRGPESASFTPPELRELLTLDGVRVAVDPAGLAGIDTASLDRRRAANVAALAEAAGRDVGSPRATLHLAFSWRPVEMRGDRHLTHVVLQRTSDARAGERVEIAAELALRAIGYRGERLRDVPFDEVRGILPNAEGRIYDEQGRLCPREYAVGWIKRGPVGVIGRNKSDAAETVRHLVEDLRAAPPGVPERTGAEELLAQRGLRPATYADWLRIDAAERELGLTRERRRTKIERWHLLKQIAGVTDETAPGPDET